MPSSWKPDTDTPSSTTFSPYDLRLSGQRVTDEHRPARANPVAPARRSPSASAKAALKTGPGKQPIRGFRDLIDHLATLTRDTITVSGQPVSKLATPTPDQRRAFDLIGVPIPLTLT